MHPAFSWITAHRSSWTRAPGFFLALPRLGCRRRSTIGWPSRSARGPHRHRLLGLKRLIEQEPEAELRIVLVCVEQGVGAVGLPELGGSDRLGSQQWSGWRASLTTRPIDGRGLTQP